MNHNIIYYSNKCEPSKQLIMMLENEDLLKYFYKVCVDTSVSVPPIIRETPTLIIKGVPAPFAGANAFRWLSRVRQWKISQILGNIEKQAMTMGDNTTESDTDLLGFNKYEMGGISDNFSFFSQDIENECHKPLPQSYCKFNNDDNKIITPPLQNGTNKVKKGGCAMTKQEIHGVMKQAEFKRKQQDTQFRKNMEHLQSIYKQKN